MAPWLRLDLATADDARALLRVCCGSSRWVERMLARRPFRDRTGMLNAAREEWFGLGETDWREAFAHHPKIGDREALRSRFASTSHLSAREQQGVDDATSDVLTALTDANRAYEERFGFIFIVCATGRSASEMLQMLRARLQNDRDTELRLAAEEQAKITEIRLLTLS
jgi:2-oxo-4-hydroxy-4-carboxy-5-ureidoimidazoline decarboxylase